MALAQQLLLCLQWMREAKLAVEHKASRMRIHDKTDSRSSRVALTVAPTLLPEFLSEVCLFNTDVSQHLIGQVIHRSAARLVDNRKAQS